MNLLLIGYALISMGRQTDVELPYTMQSAIGSVQYIKELGRIEIYDVPVEQGTSKEPIKFTIERLNDESRPHDISEKIKGIFVQGPQEDLFILGVIRTLHFGPHWNEVKLDFYTMGLTTQKLTRTSIPLPKSFMGDRINLAPEALMIISSENSSPSKPSFYVSASSTDKDNKLQSILWEMSINADAKMDIIRSKNLGKVGVIEGLIAASGTGESRLVLLTAKEVKSGRLSSNQGWGLGLRILELGGLADLQLPEIFLDNFDTFTTTYKPGSLSLYQKYSHSLYIQFINDPVFRADVNLWDIVSIP